MRHGLLLAALLYAAGATGTALATPSPPDNPSANITFSPPASCYGSPTSATCENAVVSALNSAHAALGLGPYTVPADFDSLPPAEQMFILSNLDREAFGLPTIVGLSSDLNSAAALGVAEDSDPDPEPELPADLPLEGWDSNWAGGFVNAPDAYYEWMYDDGPGSPNEDCGAGGGGGCWGHRDDVLAFSNAGALVMGAASGTDGGGMAGYAMTIVATQDASTSWTTLTYTWAQAQADIGGGSSSGGSGGGSSGGSGSAAAPRAVAAPAAVHPAAVHPAAVHPAAVRAAAPRAPAAPRAWAPTRPAAGARPAQAPAARPDPRRAAADRRAARPVPRRPRRPAPRRRRRRP